jgi:hypothetical protein
MAIVGRKQESILLKSILEEEESSFLAVYGRRRVGKTYLIRETYRKHILFECSGVHKKSMAEQLENFWRTLSEVKSNKIIATPPRTWIEAFFQLRAFLNTQSEDTKKVIFLDEIAWFDTARSGFLGALDSFWNQYCTKRRDIVLVICGSAASWIINKVVNDRGGLHNRLTHRLQLMPFTLGETQAFLKSKKVKLSPYEIAQIYMCVGGIPFYLKDIKNGFSVPQILDQLFLGKFALLKDEFRNLYASLFKNNTYHEQVVAALASKNKGLTRNEIIEIIGIKAGGGLSIVLEELIQCGFVRQILPINKLKEDYLYRLIDEYSLFYFKFLEDEKTNSSWQQVTQRPAYKIWSGYAFENLCFKHTDAIKKALGISGVITNEYSFNYKGNEYLKGAQIDLVIDREDNVINVLEAKFHNEEYVVTEAYARQLVSKTNVFRERTKTRKAIFITLLSVFGVQKNPHYLSVVTNQLLLEDLFV